MSERSSGPLTLQRESFGARLARARHIDAANDAENAVRRNTQLNVRLSRSVRVRGLRVEPQLDVFNLTNANQVLGMTTRYGAAWQNATSILAPRVFKLGAQVSF